MFHPDAPIDAWPDDRLRRRSFVHRLTTAIESWNASRPLVIGLYGEWGEGKSSILNLVATDMAPKADWTVVRFNPWNFNSIERVVSGFLRILQTAILATTPPTSANIVNLVFDALDDSLSMSLNGQAVNNIPPGVGFSESRHTGLIPDPIEDSIMGLAEVIAESNQRYLVLIDDLDRLDSTELMILMKTVKLWTMLDRITYILAFDRRQVFKTLRNDANTDWSFLHKIVNLDLELPKLDEEDIRTLTMEFLRELSSEVQVDIDPERMGLKSVLSRYDKIWPEGYRNFFSTARALKRYFNAIAFTVPLVKSEVNYSDYLALECIRVFKPEVYSKLYELRYDIASFDSSSYRDRRDEVKERRDEKYQLLLDLSGSDRDAVSVLLESVFPQLERGSQSMSVRYTSSDTSLSWQSEQRACHPSYIDKYFMFGVPSSELPDTIVYDLIQSVNQIDEADAVSLVANFLRSMKARGSLLDAFSKLPAFKESVDPSRRLSVAIGIASCSSLLQGRVSAIEVTDANMALTSIIRLLQRDDGELTNWTPLIIEIMDSSETLYFAASLAVNIFPNRNQIVRPDDILDEAEIKQNVRRIMRSRLSDNSVSIFEIESSEVRSILTVWGSWCDSKSEVTAYTIRMTELDESFLPDVLTLWFDRSRDGGPPAFQFSAFQEVFDVDRLRSWIGDREPEDLSSDESAASSLRALIEALRREGSGSDEEGRGK